jgi:hypothetical protein
VDPVDPAPVDPAPEHRQELMWAAAVLCGIAERGPGPRSQAAVHHPLQQPAPAHQYYSTVGYSDFHNFMGFTGKKLPNNILKMFVKKIFQLVQQFFVNLHSTSSQKYP